MQDEVDTLRRGMTLANKVTVLRILGTPVFVLLMVYYIISLHREDAVIGYRVCATVIFFAVALTDALDGYLARTRQEVTRIGTILDPLADKILVLSTVFLFTRPSLPALQPQFPIWFAVAVISREGILILGSLIIYLLHGDVRIQPRWTGKLATICSLGCVGWALCNLSYRVFDRLVLIAGGLTILAGVQYVFDGLRQLEDASPRGG